MADAVGPRVTPCSNGMGATSEAIFLGPWPNRAPRGPRDFFTTTVDRRAEARDRLGPPTTARSCVYRLFSRRKRTGLRAATGIRRGVHGGFELHVVGSATPAVEGRAAIRRGAGADSETRGRAHEGFVSDEEFDIWIAPPLRSWSLPRGNLLGGRRGEHCWEPRDRAPGGGPRDQLRERHRIAGRGPRGCDPRLAGHTPTRGSPPRGVL